MNKIINFTDFKIFEINNKKYIYCIEDNKIYEIDDRTVALLNQNEKTYEDLKNNLAPLFNEGELDDLIKSMYECGIIENKDNTVKSNFNQIPTDISWINLLVVQDCNLRCSYCYAEDGKYQNSGVMDIDTAKKSVDFLINKSKCEKIGICFFGGEPLLNFKLIKEVVDYCNKKEKETGKKFGFSMTSNGTLLNDEIEEFIIKNNIKLQISIDGDKKTHDLNRYYSNKVGSHDTVLKKTKALRDKGLLDARATITTNELDLVHTYDYLCSLGFDRISLSPAFNLLTVEDYDKLADAYIDFYLNFEKRIKDRKFEEVKNNMMFMQQLSYIHNSQIRTTACGAGHNLNAISINGDIYPCQRFVGTKEVLLGNVFNGYNSQLDFVENVTINNFKTCNECWIRNLCVGGCVHDNFAFNKNLNLPYDPQCEYRKKIVTEAIKIYLRLSDEEIYELFEN
ncbi:radical SAM protein (plasmid) [Paraclostridium bifermentans]|uniref:Radical SAM protein n=1 Tax=Paraclostridium bifermentans TaxID=1490 RepID=A0ABY8RB18_PARBF|nr:radical SAM protein [Paraclostridium bifermentans]